MDCEEEGQVLAKPKQLHDELEVNNESLGKQDRNCWRTTFTHGGLEGSNNITPISMVKCPALQRKKSVLLYFKTCSAHSYEIFSFNWMTLY